MRNRLDRTVATGACALMMLAFAGCGIVSSGDPETALVELAGSEGSTVTLIVSNDFTTRPSDDPEDGRSIIVLLTSSDTLTVQSPYSQRFDLGARRRFFVNALNPVDGSVNVTMRVSIDDDERFQSTRDITPDDGMEFVYLLGT